MGGIIDRSEGNILIQEQCEIAAYFWVLRDFPINDLLSQMFKSYLPANIGIVYRLLDSEMIQDTCPDYP